MTTDVTYTTSVARLLHRMGRWDESLAALPADAVAQRAEIVVDRFWWRLDDPAAAEEAVSDLLPSDPVFAGYLGAQVRYTRLVFGLDPHSEDLRRVREDFTAATADARLAAWAVFWLGVLADNIDSDPGTAGSAYQQALEQARERGDALLESYVVRHLGAHLVKQNREQGIAQLRWSYHLRASLGARPQTAAAALTLARELEPGSEADQLREAAGLTARELELTWLLRTL
jgi:hypothetical protein